MLNYTTLLHCMQQIRVALRSSNREALTTQLEALDAMVGPQKVLDIYGRLLLEETAAPLPRARRGRERPRGASYLPEALGH